MTVIISRELSNNTAGSYPILQSQQSIDMMLLKCKQSFTHHAVEHYMKKGMTVKSRELMDPDFTMYSFKDPDGGKIGYYRMTDLNTYSKLTSSQVVRFWTKRIKNMRSNDLF